MTAYIVIGLTPKKPELLQEYSKNAAPTVAKFKGEFLIKGPSAAMHGAVGFQNQAIIAFPSKEKAQQWYESEEYQALIPLRDQAMDSSFLLVRE